VVIAIATVLSSGDGYGFNGAMAWSFFNEPWEADVKQRFFRNQGVLGIAYEG